MARIRDATAEHGAQLELAINYEFSIAGQALSLGPAAHRFMHVRLAGDANVGETPGNGKNVTVELIPGADDRYEVELVGAERETSLATVVSRLDEYAGRWVGQAGNEIVEVGDSPAEVMNALRRQGRKAAVWRVPSSKEEADAILTFGRSVS